jgi:non-ribosomal peptide synthetase-like protein
MILRGPSRPDLIHHEILADIFEASAARHPEHPALIAGGRSVSYSELNDNANRIAHHLIRLGVRPGHLIGLWLPRGIDLLTVQLAIAKTGAGWLPFDADTPEERIITCLADAQAYGLVTSQEKVGQMKSPGCTVWQVEALRQNTDDPLLRRTVVSTETPAYVIYTSGSTGKPKGVPISQGAICHFLRSENSVLGIRGDDIVYQGFSVAFDMSFEEIWISYLVGATLWLAPQEITADPEALPRALKDNGITVLHAVPTLLALFTQEIPSLRLINLGGERCPQRVADQWAHPGREVFNTYGPTEATVSASIATLHAGKPVSIGKPLPNYGLLVVDEAMQLLPVGRTGELCIIGPGIAAGYLGRPGLTAEKFLPNPWAQSDNDKRLYRSGDMAHIDDAGQIHCLGRVDDQVKVRGFRVELGEIESQLNRQTGVGTAAVVLKQVGEIEQLVAYVVPAEGAMLDTTHLRQQVREWLPAYMVPNHFVQITELPRLTSGKVDRKSLQAQPLELQARPVQSDTPESAEEEALFAALAKLFPGLSIQREADFFDDLGGHSLLAARLVSVLRTDARYAHLTVNDIYRGRRLTTIREAMQAEHRQTARPLPDWQPFAPLRRLLCGLAQAISLPFVIGLHIMNWLAPFFTYHLYTGDPGDSIPFAILASVLVFLGANLFSLAVAIVANRVLLLKLPAGHYPLWGATHFRWWLADRLQQATPAYLLSGSSLYTGYLRALGAHIGKDVVIGSVTIRQPHLLKIGQGTSIGSMVHLENVRVERGELVVGNIDLGTESYIGSYSVVEGDCSIADQGRLEGLSALSRGGRIGPTETWEGSPARKLESTDRVSMPPRPHTSGLRHFCEGLFFTAGGALVSVLFFLPLFPAFALIDSLEGRILAPTLEGSGYLLAALEYTVLAIPASAILVVGTILISVAIRWMVLPRMHAGRWPVHSGMYCRKWLANLIQIASLQVLHGIYATIFAPGWYRMLGAKIGRGAEISTAMGIVPDMLTLGDETFIADAVMLGDEQVDGGWMSLDYTVIGRRSFVGNGAYVPDGTVLPEDVLIGVQSKTPASASMQSGQTWVGSPAVKLPSREIIKGFPEHLTFRPTLWRWLGRGLIEATRIILPLALVIGVGYVIVLDAMPYAACEDWIGLILNLSRSGLYYGMGCFLFVLALKWLLIRRYTPKAAPMWTPFVWISEALTSIYESIAVPNFLEYLRGTPMLPFALRLLGARIGHCVYLDTTDLTEFDCVRIGDHSELNAWAGPQTHLFEDRVMKVGRVDIGCHVTLGIRSTVLYDSRIDNDVLLGPLSLVMKGERLPSHSAWLGSPVQPWHP